MALVCVVLSRSATVMAVLIAAAAPFSVYASVEPVPSTGASLAAVTFTVEVTVLLPVAPSLTV